MSFRQISEFNRGSKMSCATRFRRSSGRWDTFLRGSAFIHERNAVDEPPLLQSGLQLLDTIPGDAWNEFIVRQFAKKRRKGRRRGSRCTALHRDLFVRRARTIAHGVWDYAESARLGLPMLRVSEDLVAGAIHLLRTTSAVVLGARLRTRAGTTRTRANLFRVHQDRVPARARIHLFNGAIGAPI